MAQKRADPRPVDPQKIVEAIFDADGWTPEGQAERKRLLAELESLPPLDAASVTKWKKTCAKLSAKGPKLERKSGQQFLWEKPVKRGLYIVGGEDTKPKALLIAMHGGGAGAGDAWSAHGEYQPAASKLGWLLISPEVLEKTERGWTDSGTEEFVMQLVEQALRTWKIDPDRVFFSGHSMGGYGTWTLGAHHADRVAALAPSAGAPTPVSGLSGRYVDVAAGVIPSLRNVPLVIYQSDNDQNVPPDANRLAVELLARARERWGGFEFEYWQVPGRGHDLPPGGMEALLAKVEKRQRNPRPVRLVWQPALSWKKQFYWLWWETPKAGTILEAEADKVKNEIRIQGKPATPIEVLLDERLVDLLKDVIILLNGKEVFRGKPQATLETLVRTALSGDEELVFASSVRIKP